MRDNTSKALLPASRPSLSRARVLDVIGDEVIVRLDYARTEEVFRAELAVPAYSAQPGDSVLVASGSDGAFVLGVLGQARHRCAISETEGVVTLSASKRVVIQAPGVEIRAELASIAAAQVAIQSRELELEATTLIERATNSYRHAEEAHSYLGSSRTSVRGDCDIIAARTSIVSEADTRIDGERVLLG